MVYPNGQRMQADKIARLIERNGIPSRKKDESHHEDSETLARLSEVERALSILLTGELPDGSEDDSTEGATEQLSG